MAQVWQIAEPEIGMQCSHENCEYQVVGKLIDDPLWF